MSFDIVLESLERTESRIKEISRNVPYEFQLQSLERGKDLFSRWLNVYKAYANGYRKELLTRTSRYVIRMLSSFTDELERRVRKIFEAKIPNESYILVNEFFKQLGKIPITFVLSEGSLFEQTSVFRQLSDTINRLSAPRPVRGASTIDIIMHDIETRDIIVLCYEEGQYDNVLSWPLLLHEAFHHLYASERLDRLAKGCPKVPWLEEALIDMYIVNYFGPAYALSLSTYLQRFPHERSISHPSFVARIFIALQYLTRMKKQKILPLPISEYVTDVFDYLNKVWSQHKEVITAPVQDEVEEIYSTAEEEVVNVISEKTQPFSEFLTENEENRRKIHARGGFEFVENQVLSVSDVIEYFEAGIPVAADPRIVFNAFISRKSQEMIHDPRLRIYIVESLKKWHLKKAWLATKATSYQR